MAWIIVSANGEELDRRELTAPVVVGRSSECDIAVRDIMLSRKHCRLEPVGNDWRVVDLQSKNGTRVGWQEVTEHLLRDGDHLRMGRTRIVFSTADFEPAPERKPRPDRIVRPADPHEALSGTVTDFVYVEEEPHDATDRLHHHAGDRTLPQPRPVGAASSHAEPPAAPSPLDDLAATVHGGEVAPGTSSATVTVPTRTVARALPRVPAKAIGRAPRRPGASETDLSLQVHDHGLTEAQTPPPLFAPPGNKPSTRRRVVVTVAVTLAAAIGTGIVVVSLWLLMLSPR